MATCRLRLTAQAAAAIGRGGHPWPNEAADPPIRSILLEARFLPHKILGVHVTSGNCRLDLLPTAVAILDVSHQSVLQHCKRSGTSGPHSCLQGHQPCSHPTTLSGQQTKAVSQTSLLHRMGGPAGEQRPVAAVDKRRSLHGAQIVCAPPGRPCRPSCLL